jgi:hypothetical protein
MNREFDLLTPVQRETVGDLFACALPPQLEIEPRKGCNRLRSILLGGRNPLSKEDWHRP